MNRELVLHIGTEKTGTTSLQNTLFSNHEYLKELGVLVPKSFKLSNHVEMTVCFQNYSDSSELYSVVGISNDSYTVSAFKENFLEKLKNEILSSDCSRVVISNEHLHSRINSPQEVREIANWAKGLFDKVTIDIYLRRQCDLAVSHFSTALKSGSTNIEPLPSNATNSLYYNYENLLNLWGGEFENVNVKPFSKKMLYKNDVVFDFFHNSFSLNDDEISQLELKLDDNKSLGINALSFLAQANKTIPFLVDGKLNPKRRRLVQYLEEMEFQDEPLKIPHTTLVEFQSQFSESNSRCSFIPERVSDYLNGEIKENVSNYELFLSKLNQEYDFSLVLWNRCIDMINFLELRNVAFRARISLLEGNLIEAERILFEANKFNKKLPIIDKVAAEIAARKNNNEN